MEENYRKGYELWLNCRADIFIKDISRGYPLPKTTCSAANTASSSSTLVANDGIFGVNWPIYSTLLFNNQ